MTGSDALPCCSPGAGACRFRHVRPGIAYLAVWRLCQWGENGGGLLEVAHGFEFFSLGFGEAHIAFGGIVLGGGGI